MVRKDISPLYIIYLKLLFAIQVKNTVFKTPVLNSSDEQMIDRCLWGRYKLLEQSLHTLIME